ncbi:hypothetical protein [Virgibacillus ainsalahensis]
MNNFEKLVSEFRTKLERNLSQKEMEWMKWVTDRENVMKKQFLCQNTERT